jgi:hypothetical protein
VPFAVQVRGREEGRKGGRKERIEGREEGSDDWKEDKNIAEILSFSFFSL